MHRKFTSLVAPESHAVGLHFFKFVKLSFQIFKIVDRPSYMSNNSHMESCNTNV